MVVVYYKKFFDFTRISFYVKLIIAVIPAVIFGLLLKKHIDEALENLYFIAAVMIGGGVIFLFVDRWFKHPRIDSERHVSNESAFRIGCFQVLSILLPGFSRSGATIIGGLSQGLTRKAAAEFSFFLAVPTMLAASVKSLWDVHKEHPDVLTKDNATLLGLSGIVTFLVVDHRYPLFYRLSPKARVQDLGLLPDRGRAGDALPLMEGYPMIVTAPRRVINGWAMYDWANSVYNLVITTTFFPIYFLASTQHHFKSTNIPFLGRTFDNGALYSFALAAAYLFISVLYPILTSIADNRGNKKSFMRFFCYMGAAGCSLLYFFDGSNLGWGIGCFMLASMGFVGSLVFYNAYLPEIAAPEDQDAVSAKGFSYGYIGSVIMQVLGFALVLALHQSDLSLRLTFLMVGLWWAGFAQMTFAVLPKSKGKAAKTGSIVQSAFSEVRKVYREIRKMSVLKRFLRGFFFYSMGVQTVMSAATIFGAKLSAPG